MYTNNSNTRNHLNQENSSSLFTPPNRPKGGGGSEQEGQTYITCPSLVANAGFDTVHMTYHAIIPGEILASLSDLKKSIQSGTEKEGIFKFGVSNLFSFNLNRSGTGFYSFILRTGDISICISTRKVDSTIPNMAIQIGSISCQDNLSKLHETLMIWLSYNRIQIKEEKVQRLDMCCDLDIDIENTGIDNRNRTITRASNTTIDEHHYRLTGKIFGRGGIIMLRAYDKLWEINTKQADYKETFFREKWGTVENITRFEFQLRRAAIKQMFPRKSDLKTIMLFASRIWEYLTNDWFRMTESDVDRTNKHQSRAATSFLWLQVQRAFNPIEQKAVTRKRKQRHINIKSLVKQAVGCMVSVCAGVGHTIDDLYGMYETIHGTMVETFREYVQTVEFRRGYDRRVAGAFVSF